MTCDMKNKILHIGSYKKVKLSNSERKLLICLSSENVTTYEEILQYVYGANDEYARKTLFVTIFRLRKKSKKQLRIRTIRARGLILETEIFYK